jgi:hypothetical protein
MLKSCHEWLVDNKLSLHLGKTESIIFVINADYKNFLWRILKYLVMVYILKLKVVLNNIGIMIDQFLSGDLIVSSIIKRVNQRLKCLYRNRNCLSLQSRKTLCSTLIQCHFDYTCACWYEGLTKKYER